MAVRLDQLAQRGPAELPVVGKILIALEGADGVVILTEWNEFRALDTARMKALLKRPLMVDLRNIYNPDQMAQAGFHYVSVGRKTTGG